MTAGIIVSIVGILAALLLAGRGIRRVEPSSRWKMALAWLAIIVGVVLVIQAAGLGIAA
jgi:hypothetical protein